MAAVIGQRLPKLTKNTLTKFRTDESLDHFYADVACKSEGLLSEPTLPRKRRTLVRLEVGAGAPSYTQTAKDHFRGVYYEGIHLIVGLFITAFSAYAQMETLLVKAHIGDDEAEFSFLMRHTAKMLIQGRYLSN